MGKGVVTMNKCGNCQWLVTADGEPYYCAIKDLYTIKDKQDEGCEDFLEADDGQRKSRKTLQRL